jgi:hypothetical protein
VDFGRLERRKVRCRANIGRAMLGVVNNNGLFAPGWHEDLDSFVAIAVGALIGRALNAHPPLQSKKGPTPAGAGLVTLLSSQSEH